MNSNFPIAVFDSGVGSYSIVRVLQKNLPNESIIYLADRASFPYGRKSHEELKNIVEQTINWLEKNYQPKLIIVASNTPSIQVLDEIKDKYKTVIIGVFPPVEEVIKISQTKHVAILATKGAVESTEIDDFIAKKNFSKDFVIHKVNATDLVALVEPGIFQKDKIKTEAVIKFTIDPVLKNDPAIDVMTLSSTHLPFLLEDLKKNYPNITFLDPAEETAEGVKNILKEMGKQTNASGSLKVITTVDKENKLKPEELKNILATLGLKTEIEVVSIK